MAQEHNVTDVLPGHNHAGPPSYVMYSQSCRGPECLAEFRAYQLRLAARRLRGDFRDLRLRENRIVAAMEELAAQRPPAPGPEPAPGEPGQAAERPALPAPEPAAPDTGPGEPQRLRETPGVAVDPPPHPPAPETATKPLSDTDRLLRRILHAADAKGNVPVDWASAPFIARAMGISANDAQAALKVVFRQLGMSAVPGGWKLTRRPVR